jgi:hypothetical protein
MFVMPADGFDAGRPLAEGPIAKIDAMIRDMTAIDLGARIH